MGSLTFNQTASHNTAVGFNSLNANTTGTQNVAVGASALDANTTASYNTAIGEKSLSTNILGSKSTAVGTFALFNQNPASAGDMYNVAVGYDAGNAVTTASALTLIGGDAGVGLTTGHNNTLIGFNAGNYSVVLATGITNTIIGSYAYTSATDTNQANVFGHAVAGAGGYTTLGLTTNDIRAAHGNVTWATVSDERYKKDIVDSTAGLSFINALQPRTFKYKNLGELPETFNAYKADSTKVFKNSDTNHGFIAQEIKAAIDADSSIKDGFRLWDSRDDGSQEVAEAALIPILVKAIQEQNALIESLTARITTLEG